MRIPWVLLSLGIIACGSAARAGAPQPFSDDLFLDWNELRSALREYYPAALEAFDSLTERDALAILGRAPTPQQGTRLSLSKISAALKAAGRQRNIETRARAQVHPDRLWIRSRRHEFSIA